MHYGYGYFEEGHPGKIHDWRLWKRLYPYLRPHRGEIALAVGLSLAISAAGLVLPYLIRLGVDRYIVAPHLSFADRMNGLAVLAGLFVGLMVAAFVLNFLQVLLLEWSGQRIMHRLRQDLFQHVVHLDLPFFHANPVGKLVTRLTNDIQNMHEMFTSVIITVFNDLIRIVGILAILFWMDWSLTLILAALIPLTLILTLKFSAMAREAFRVLRTRLARINAFIQEVLGGLDIIQIHDREDDTIARFRQINEAHRRAAFHQIRIFGLFVPAMELLNTTSMVVILVYGGSQILDGSITLGILVAFLSYIRLFFQPLRELSQKFSIVQSALASAERIFELLDTHPPAPRLSVAPDPPSTVKGEITFEGVTFGYHPEKPVLRDVSFHVPAGETLAVVGPTGAGKTTLINLLERFYDPDLGRILLDGRDLRTLDPSWIRRHMGLVMQDVFLVPGTLRENICLDLDLDAAELQRILRLAQLDDVVAKLPQGLETPMGEGGLDLSAGQKQLLALARVLARNPKILILDEATSSVDSETEMRMERAVSQMLRGRTAMVIAHRLSTIRHADRILVLDRGRVAEQGTHEELMASGGIYYQYMILETRRPTESNSTFT